ncbi:hypothetical protein D3C72_2215530 [compost metagenome]
MAQHGVVPADQRLEAGDIVGLKLILGLVVQLQLAVNQRVAQMALNFHPLGEGLLQRGSI